MSTVLGSAGVELDGALVPKKRMGQHTTTSLNDVDALGLWEPFLCKEEPAAAEDIVPKLHQTLREEADPRVCPLCAVCPVALTVGSRASRGPGRVTAAGKGGDAGETRASPRGTAICPPRPPPQESWRPLGWQTGGYASAAARGSRGAVKELCRLLPVPVAFKGTSEAFETWETGRSKRPPPSVN
ncbi:hypothetical protein AAFF_G00385460 [Aldrovandia affinis]|uniref:Uncharacterized protein n=1 Tax=Aldrovandia affinis TaxID=143900 RepID=A0AAD7SEW0_9TELE|nr:hypothetical protein AAFF_G00385460 [Aldrovandia affinis]